MTSIDQPMIGHPALVLRQRPARTTRRDALEFELLRGLVFPIFFVAAAAARLQPGRPRGRSILAQARIAADNAIALAFMG